MISAEIATEDAEQTYENYAVLKGGAAPSTTACAMGGATPPMRYKAVESVCGHVVSADQEMSGVTYDGRDVVLIGVQIKGERCPLCVSMVRRSHYMATHSYRFQLH